MLMKRLLLSLGLALLVGARAAAAPEVVQAYFKADNIPGDATRARWESYVNLIGYSHEVVTPRDPASGLPTGKRQHKPFTILKENSANSPVFHQAQIKNTVIPKAELILVKLNPNGDGTEIIAYTYRFTNVRIVSIRDWMPNSTEHLTGAPYPQEIAFTYSTIEWDSGKAVASDSTSVDR